VILQCQERDSAMNFSSSCMQMEKAMSCKRCNKSNAYGEA
jgi:hypothetical protein